MSKYQGYTELLITEATIPANGGEVKMPEADWRAQMQKLGAKVLDNMANPDSGERDIHVAKDKNGNRIGHYDKTKKAAFFEKRHGQGKLNESADAKFKAAVSDINTMLTDASRKAAALGKDAKSLEDAIDKARDIAFKLR